MQHEGTAQSHPSAADLRADIARAQIPIYQVAAVVRMHPMRLGMVLNEKRPLSPELAQRIHAAIHDETRAQ
jgi:plasmid maintenance system antidote protein VapI